MSEPQKGPKDDGNQRDTSIERVFLANDVLPNAAESFGERIVPLDEAVQTGDVVLDTNVLLLPYGAGASSLKHVIAAFKKLKSESRLFLPAQVAREFVKNRPNKLSELQQGLGDKISRYVVIDKLSFPILEGVDEYKQLNQALEQTSKLKSELTKASSALLKKIRAWEWNDPVNIAYREVFTSDRIVDLDLKREETLAELQRRQRLSIPPGYKDAGKEDLGVGDFLIWKTVLAIGQKNKKHVIFVSGDEKADWQHRAGGAGFLPRFELLDEFRRTSAGKFFYIIPLSSLLELLKVEKNSIEEIKKEEARVHEANSVKVNCPDCSTEITWQLADHLGASATPRCSLCSKPFHIHRTRNGVTVHKVGERMPTETAEVDRTILEKVVVQCPSCQDPVDGAVGTYFNATTWCRCGNCEYLFPIHRKGDGSVMVSRARRATE